MEVNLVVLVGRVADEPVVSRSQADRPFVTFGVRPDPASGSALVPVTLWEPPDWVAGLEPESPVLVVGRVRRRFFRVQGATVTRVDVEAEWVARPTRARRVAALTAVSTSLGLER